jgi:hypothetical protein
VVSCVLAGTFSAHGPAPAPRVWLASPTVVAGSGFHAGKVTVSAQVQGGRRVRIVRARANGRFAARFAAPIRAAECRVATISAVGADGSTAALKLAGASRSCPPPIEP